MKELILKTQHTYIFFFILMSIVVIFVLMPYLFFRVNEPGDKYINSYIFFISIFIGYTMHEIIHAIFFSIFSRKGFRSIKFGMNYIFLFCHCKLPLTAKQYRVSAIMPTILLGILPILVAFIIKNYTLLSFGCVMFLAGTGDILLLWKSRELASATIINDHPGKVGFLYKEI